MGTQLESPSVGNPPKFSRYRSVRRAAAAAAETQNQQTGDASSGQNVKPSSETIARSMSRYHRPKTATNNSSPTANYPPVPALPPSVQASVQTRQPTQEAQRSQKTNPNSIQNNSPHLSDEGDGLSETEKARIREETMRQLTLAEQLNPSSHSHVPARPQTSQNKQSKFVPEPREKRSSWKDKLGLSHHAKTEPDAADDSAHDHHNGMDSVTRHLAPNIDAPVSAVNAGERRVLVKFKSSSIKLPVTPTTRVKDVIYSAANCFSERVDPSTAIIVEAFASLGLERPLRRYEHVRDVLNSWSADHEYALVISDAPSKGASDRLELRNAPVEQSKDAKFYLYHSSKPGKWDKRYITLRADGQVVLSKKSEAKEKDYTNICHMSDFDIYTPTGRQAAKTLKTPKKICFAIKSQQKSSMFISTENFVHFFATNDSSIAQGFHDAVHSWRSWYLVHVLEVGQKETDTAAVNGSKASLKDSTASPVHQRHVSTDSIPYQLGSFKPLIEFGKNSEPIVAVEKNGGENSSSSRDMFLRKKKARDRAPPPSSFPVNLPTLDTATNESLSLRDETDSNSPFSPDSLLGRTYSQRQAAQRAKEAKESEETGPFLAHGLLKKNTSPVSADQVSLNMACSSSSSRQVSRSNTVRSQHHPTEGASHSRSNSVRQKPKPLVDLTPTFREAPQHVRKGHGVKVGAGIPLVEVATGPELIPGVPTIPSATTWRRDEAAATARPTTAANEPSSASIVTRHRANTLKSQTQSNHTHQNDYGGSPDSANPFMPNGLVSLSGINNAVDVQAHTSTGRGVATGDRHAARPLLDMTPQSQFAEGSLLREIERNY